MGLSWAYFFFSHVPFGSKKTISREKKVILGTGDHHGPPNHWFPKFINEGWIGWLCPPKHFETTLLRVGILSRWESQGLATQTRRESFSFRFKIRWMPWTSKVHLFVFHSSSQSTNWESPSEASSLCASFMLIFPVVIPLITFFEISSEMSASCQVIFKD